MTTPFSHSTRRTITRVADSPRGWVGSSRRFQLHESDVMPYVPLCARRYDADADTALPMPRREVE